MEPGKIFFFKKKTLRWYGSIFKKEIPKARTWSHCGFVHYMGFYATISLIPIRIMWISKWDFFFFLKAYNNMVLSA